MRAARDETRDMRGVEHEQAPTSSAIERSGTGSMMREYAVAPAMMSRGRSRLAISRTLSKSMRSSLFETPYATKSRR